MPESLQHLIPSRKFFLLHEFLVIACVVYVLTHDILFIFVLAMPFVFNMLTIAYEDGVNVSVIQTGEHAKVEAAVAGTDVSQSIRTADEMKV